MTEKKPSLNGQNPQDMGQKADKNPPKDEKGGFADQGLLEPTRFGDWEVRGRCSDF